MFIQWGNSIHPSTTDTAEYRSSIRQLHDKMVTPGTGITHLADFGNQLNFDSVNRPGGNKELIPNNMTLPLYYVFTPNTGKPVYITVRYFTYNWFMFNVIAVVRVSNELSNYSNFHALASCDQTDTKTYDDYISSGQRLINLTDVTILPGNLGFIYTNIDTGVICIGSGLGTRANMNKYEHYKYPIMFVLAKADDAGAVFMTPKVDDNTSMYFEMQSAGDKNAFSSTSVSHAGSGFAQKYNMVNFICDVDASPDLVPLYLMNSAGKPTVFEDVYTYNRNSFNPGIMYIEGEEYYLLGDSIRTWNIGGNDNISLAIKTGVLIDGV